MKIVTEFLNNGARQTWSKLGLMDFIVIVGAIVTTLFLLVSPMHDDIRNMRDEFRKEFRTDIRGVRKEMHQLGVDVAKMDVKVDHLDMAIKGLYGTGHPVAPNK